MKHYFRNLHGDLIALAALASFGIAMISVSVNAAEMTVYKTPSCGCCTKWVDHLEENGFEVTVQPVEDLIPVKSRLGVPQELQSCHTAEIDGYVIEGHVPTADIERLLEEGPHATGIAVPGMPVGSPGMEYGERKDPYDVILFGEDVQITYATH